MLKRMPAILALAGTLFAFEDVSFSARSLGLGGEHSAYAQDAFSMFTNPALPARYERPVVSLCAAPYFGETFYWTASYAQPVPDLGVLGGSLFYYNRPSVFASSRTGDADLRFFAAFPLGRYFSLGASVGSHTRWVTSADFFYEAFVYRFGEGPSLSLGTWLTHPNGLNLALSMTELSLVDFSSAISRFGISWNTDFGKPSILSSLSLAGDGGIRFTDEIIKAHLGGETWFLRGHLGLRAGMRFGTGQLAEFSPTAGASIRTHRREKTDFELHYGVAFNYSHGTDGMIFDDGDSTMILHQLSLSVLFGDALKERKDSILAAQAERARRLREEALARERDRLRQELQDIKEERAVLEKQREDIQRLQQEALQEVARMRGVDITETDSTVKVTITEDALRFEPGSARIPFPQGYRVLSGVAGMLLNYPNRPMRVEVYAGSAPLPEEDSIEVSMDKEELSSARAENIMLYLTDVCGLEVSNLEATGIGEARPVEDEAEEEPLVPGRVEIIIFK